MTAVELARAVARAAAAVAIPARKGTPRRAAGAPPSDLVHRRPPRRHRLHPVRRGHRQPARPADHREPRRASWPAWPAAASRSTATGTATARPRPGWASRPAGRAWPPAPRQPRSASASPWPPDPTQHPPARGTGRRPERQPGASGMPVTLRETPAEPQGSQTHQATPADHAEVNGIEITPATDTHPFWSAYSLPLTSTVWRALVWLPSAHGSGGGRSPVVDELHALVICSCGLARKPIVICVFGSRQFSSLHAMFGVHVPSMCPAPGGVELTVPEAVGRQCV